MNGVCFYVNFVTHLKKKTTKKTYLSMIVKERHNEIPVRTRVGNIWSPFQETVAQNSCRSYLSDLFTFTEWRSLKWNIIHCKTQPRTRAMFSRREVFLTVASSVIKLLAVISQKSRPQFFSMETLSWLLIGLLWNFKIVQSLIVIELIVFWKYNYSQFLRE